MKSLLIILLLAASVISSCNKLDIKKGIPNCVEKEIKDFNKSSACDNANVNEYTFQGEAFTLLNTELVGLT